MTPEQTTPPQPEPAAKVKRKVRHIGGGFHLIEVSQPKLSARWAIIASIVRARRAAP